MVARLLSCRLLSALCLLFVLLSASGQDLHQEDVARQSSQALCLFKEGKHTEAAALYELLLPAVERLHGPDSTNTAALLNNLALTYNALGSYAKAAPLAQRSLQIRERKLGKDDPLVAESLNNLASLYYDMGQYAKAEPLYRRGLQIREDQFGKDDPAVAASLNNLAVLYKVQGQYAKAAPLYQRSLDIWEARLGKDHLRVATALNNLANLHSDLGQYGQAATLYERSLEIRERQLGKDHPDVAQSLNNLAFLSKIRGQYEQAEQLYERSLRIQEAKLGKDHPDVATSLNNLARLYRVMGQVAKAEPLCERSLRICESSFGKTHDSVAHILTTQADLAWAKKDPDQAISLQEQAIEIFRARLGNNHPTTNHAVSRLALFFHQTDRSAEALRTIDRGLRALRVHTAQVLPMLPEAEQLRFLKTSFAEDFLDAVSMGLDPKISEEGRLRVAGWVLNGKSIAHQSLVERLLLARDNQSSEAKQLLGELEDVRRRLARLNLEGPGKADDGNFRKVIETLGTKEKQLEGQLHTTVLTRQGDPWIDIDELRQKLPKEAVYVDFLRFAPTDFADKWGLQRKQRSPIYVAWISARGQATRIVNLGPAEPIDAAIRAARADLQKAHERIRQDGEIEAEQATREKLAAVGERVLTPLLPYMKDYPQWILGPDGNLWLIPWAALPLDAKTYVIEKHTLRYVTSGRDLVLNLLQLDHKATAPTIFADPDFDMDPTKIGAAEGGEERGSSVRTARGIGKVARLLGTAAEADAITPTLAKWAGAPPQRFLEAEATVAAFRKLKGPKALVMSTHGYFLPDQDLPKHLRDQAENQPRAIPGLENPLLRSGLLLAGCNHASTSSLRQDTGVLTGLEIVGTDLRGTELVVLSACETGLGDVRNGEGVAGLRQAFQLAGAQAVVASLWSISDRETAFLMKSFFENLSTGQPRVDALRDAQLTMLRDRRERNASAHPFFWGAFTLTGR